MTRPKPPRHAHHWLVESFPTSYGVYPARCKSCGLARSFEPFRDEPKTISHYNGPVRRPRKPQEWV